MREISKEELELEIYLLSSNIEVFIETGGNADQLNGLRKKLAEYRLKLSFLAADKTITNAKCRRKN